MLFRENKFFDRKEDSLTKCYCIRRKLTVLHSPLIIIIETPLYETQNKSKLV